MIKNKYIKVKLSSSNIERLLNLGYIGKCGDIIEIDIKDLSDGCQMKIDVICDKCGNEYNIIYAKYIKNVKRNGFYNCKECGMVVRKENMKNNNLSLNEENQKKKKETFIKKYGVDNPSKSEIIKNKKKETCLKNYGVESPLKSKQVREKRNKTVKERYDVDFIPQSKNIREKIMNTVFNNFGVKNVSQSFIIKNKKEQTCLKNWGVNNHMKNSDFFKKYMEKIFKYNKYKNTDLFYQASYELDFLNYCESKNILNKVSNGPSLKYVLEKNEHIYHSDFFISDLNLIVEIKSDYTYLKEIYKNKMKEKYSKLKYNFMFIINKNYSEFNKLMNI